MILHCSGYAQQPGKIRDFTLEELKQFRLDGTKEAIPTLAEVLQLVDGQVPLLVEMKCEDLGVHVCEKADGLLKNYRGNYVMESFNPFALLWYRRHRPEICRGQLSMNFQRQEGTYDPRAAYRASSADELSREAGFYRV